MRTLWSGSVSFGLVNIPVKLYSASQSHKLDLDMLHAKDMAPVRYARICRESGEEVPWDEIVKGYEYKKGDYVVLEKEDFEKADPGHMETIDILSFVSEDEVDPNYFEKPYYMEPAKGSEKVYVLLRETLKKTGKVGIARFVFRSREHLGCIRPDNHMLVMNQMRFADELRSPEDLNIPEDVAPGKQELEMATKLVERLSVPFEPEKYHDTYHEELERIIAEKAAGKEPVPAAGPAKAEIRDLMEALKASLETGKEGGPRKHARKRA